MPQIAPQWRYKRLYSFAYPISGANVSINPVAFPIELTKYSQVDYFARLLFHVTGNVVVAGGGGAGTVTGRDNPEALLVSLQMDTTPALNGIKPVNNVSARGLLIDNTFMRGYVRRATPIADIAGTQAVDILYEVYFKRPYVRKGIEWDHAINKYSSDLLTIMFGGRDQLFSGGTNTWDLSGLLVEIFADSDLQNDADRIHNHEFFERTYPITASQTDFPIDTLPQGFLYTDLFFAAELDNVLSNDILNNVALEGGGRIWLPQGDNNATILQTAIAEYRGVISDPSYDPTGLYPLPLRDGMFTRAVDSLQSPITIKLDVTFNGGHTNLVRLIGRRMVPGAPGKSNPRRAA